MQRFPDNHGKGDLVEIQQCSEPARWIPGLKDEYAVSRDGQVFSFKSGEAYKLSARDNGEGYLMIVLCKNSVEYPTCVHQLVLRAFEGSPPTADHQTRHLDGNPSNNKLENLKWGTCKQNALDRIDHRTQVKGEAHGQSKLAKQEVIKIRNVYENTDKTQKEIAKEYNVSRSTIGKIVRGEYWPSVQGPTCENNKRKLNKKEVVQIRKMYKNTDNTQRDLADRFNLPQTAISDIVRGKTWQDAGGPIKGVDY